MKYILRENMQIDFFSDGECVVYDSDNEMMHVLNKTAAMALSIILEHGEFAFHTFVQQILAEDKDVSVTVLKNDFNNVLKNFIEAKIIIAG